MPFDVGDAIARARADRQVAHQLFSSFLASAFTILKGDEQEPPEWTLMLYDPKTHTTIDCSVTHESVVLGQEMPAQKEMQELRAQECTVSLDDALAIARTQFSHKSINVLISLHRDEKLLWNITFVGTDLVAHGFEIDAVLGDIVSHKETSLMRREK